MGGWAKKIGTALLSLTFFFSLAPMAAANSVPSIGGTDIPYPQLGGKWSSGIGRNYVYKGVDLKIFYANPVHVTPTLWQFHLFGHVSRPWSAIFLQFLIPTIPGLSNPNSNIFKNIDTLANQYGNWSVTWSEPASVLVNGNSVFGAGVYASRTRSNDVILGSSSTRELYFGENLTLDRPNLIVGTSEDLKNPILPVSGSLFRVNETLYARVVDPKGFNSTAEILLVEQKKGYAWVSYESPIFTVSPPSQIGLFPFSVSSSGTYRVSLIAAGNVIATNTIRIG